MMFVKKSFMLSVMFFAMLLVCVIVMIYEITVHNTVFDRLSFYDAEYQLKFEPYYDDEEDKYYLFLPSYTDIENMVAKCNAKKFGFSINGINYENIKDLPLKTDIVITVSGATPADGVTMQILQCENLPTVYIETGSGSMDSVDSNKNNAEKAAVEIINSNGSFEYIGAAEISGAGNSTFWQTEKKPYNVKFEEKINLFGIAEAQNWRLLANYADDSMIRNYICYNIANDIGIEYTSAMEYVSVFLNGKYNGVYTICTKYKYENDLDNICAVFENSTYSREHDYVYFVNNQSMYIDFIYGSGESIKSAVDMFNDSLLNAKSYEQIEEIIDVVSFAKKYLLETTVANTDGLSQHFAINNYGKIMAICAWDYDLSLGISYHGYIDVPYNVLLSPDWWYLSLLEFSEFRELVLSLAREYESVFYDEVSHHLSQLDDILNNDWELNNVRWRNTAYYDGLTKLKCTPKLTTLNDHAEYIKKFLIQRIDFLSNYYKNVKNYRYLEFAGKHGNMKLCYLYKTSLNDEVLPDGISYMYEQDESFLGWYTETGVELRDIDTVTEDMFFIPTWKNDNTLNSLNSSDASGDKNAIIKLIKWPIENLGYQNTAVIFAFFMMFFAVGAIEVRRGLRGKVEKDE